MGKHGIMDIGLVNCNISELRWKRLYAFLFIVLLIVTSSCRPSESQIVAAMAQTEIVRSATYAVETKTFATESALKTSAVQSTHQAATATQVFQETAARAAEETSTVVAATATASSMHRQVQELVDSGILSRSDGVYYSLAPSFSKRSGDDVLVWWETGFMPADFVIRFDVSCPYAVRDSTSPYGLRFRQTNGDSYSMNISSGRAAILRFLAADLERIQNFEVPDDWKPGDDPIFIDINPWLGDKELPGDKQAIGFMLVVEHDLFSFFADGEKLFRAYDTSLVDGNLSLFRGSTDSDCQMDNLELWILD